MRMRSALTVLFSCALAVAFVGCGNGADKKDGGAKAGDHHDHPDKGPHDGILVELGNEEYHAEVCHDDATDKVTVYILDSKAKDAVPVAEKEVKINVAVDGKPAQFVLQAVPLEGEADGKSSRFELVDESLVEAHDAEGADARLKLNINGTPYEGKIAAHVH